LRRKKLGIGHKKYIFCLSSTFLPINTFKTCLGQEKFVEDYMKKFVVLLLGALIAVSSASAASLVVNGTVSQYLNLAVTNSPITVSFTGDGTVGTPDHSASLNIKANKVVWTVTFTSGNLGLLKSASTSVSIPYYLKATGTGVGTIVNGLSSAVQLTTAKTIQATAGGKTPKNGVDYTLDVTVDAQLGTATLWEAATDYTDTVTIAITTP
jgi:hypothetical protein